MRLRNIIPYGFTLSNYQERRVWSKEEDEAIRSLVSLVFREKNGCNMKN